MVHKELREFAKFADIVFDSKNQLPIIPLTPEEEEVHKNANECHICGITGFGGENRSKVYDHCHLSGKYRGPTHSSCNLNYKISPTISVVFHNLSGYDSHYLIKDLALECKGDVDIIPQTSEKYISFTKKQIDGYDVNYKFIDSYKFMNSSLDKLASYLQTYEILKSQFSGIKDELINLLCRKMFSHTVL